MKRRTLIIVGLLILGLYGSPVIESSADLTGSVSESQITIDGDPQKLAVDMDISIDGQYIEFTDTKGDLDITVSSLHSGKSVSQSYKYDISDPSGADNIKSIKTDKFGSSDFPVGQQTKMEIKAEFKHPDIQTNAWEETITVNNDVDKTNCQTIHQSNPNAGSGVYTITPDGSSIDVYCEMNNQGGWVRLQIQDADGNRVITNDHGGRYGFDDNCGAYDDVDDKYYDSTTDLGWPRSTNTGTFTYDVQYKSGSNTLSSSEEQRIRELANEISSQTRSVSLTCDDDGHTKSGHEVTLVDGSGNQWTPTGDTDVSGSGYIGFWVHGTEQSQNTFEAIDTTFTGSGPDSARTIPDNYIVPDKMRADINSGGAVAWGYEDDYALVRLKQ